jgi:hypothetical protein
MPGQQGGSQPDPQYHGGNQPGEDVPARKPRARAKRPDIDRPEAGHRKIRRGPDPDKPGGRY